MADFGYRDGYAQMGCYKVPGGLAFVYVKRDHSESPAAGTVESWIAANTPWTAVRMITGYEPAYVRDYPTRAAVPGGCACSFPSIEADALVSAGIAAYA